jgi:hypothetical protein
MSHTPDIWPNFEDFWDAYAKKSGKVASQKEWNKLSQKDKEAAMQGVEAYVASTPDKRFRLDPERYIKRRKWDDEITPAFQHTGGVLGEKSREVHEAIAGKYAGNSHDGTPSR